MKHMKKHLRLFVALLACLTVLGSFAACGGKTDTPPVNDPGTQPVATGNGTPDINPDNPDTPQTEEALNRPVQKNYDRDFTMLTASNGSDPILYIYEENKPSGDVISNALYRRQDLMEKTYGVTLKIKIQSDTESMNELRALSITNDYLCDISMLTAKNTFKLAVEGIYTDLNQLDGTIKMDASYWDQRIQSEYLINDMLFTLEGDYTFFDELATLAVVYNKSIWDQLNYTSKYGTPYQLVEANQWTYATMMEMIKDQSYDSNNDDYMNENDTWGFVSEVTATYYFLLGSGLKPLANENGSFTLQLKDDGFYKRMYDVIEETSTMVNNKDILAVNKNGAVSGGDVWTAASDAFEYDRALFRSTTLTAVTRLKEMKSDYGILPVPEYYEDQTEYYCWVSGNKHTPLTIPKSGTDVQIAAEIAEILCYHSRYGSETVYSAFIDHLTYARLCKTAEDRSMLDLVFASKTYDIDQALEVTHVESNMYSICKTGNLTTLSSTISGLVKTADEELNALLIKINANN